MATDFRSQRIRTNSLIVSRSDAGNASFIIYSGSSATNSTGGISDANMFNSVGKDVFLFVSGTKTDESTGATRGSKNTAVALFGGDLIVSGTLYADRQVIEVEENVTGSLSVSGSMFVSGSGVVKNGLTVQLDTGAEGGTISGSIHQTDGGLSYIVGAGSITVTSASNGQVTITGAATSLEWTDNGDILSPSDGAADSVGVGGSGNDSSNYNTMLQADGTILTNNFISASLGLSGSLTRLVDDTSYIIAGSGITVVSASNGAVTISSTVTGGEWTDEGTILRPADGAAENVGIGGTGTNLEEYNTFLESSTGNIKTVGFISASLGLSGSLTRLVDGRSYLVAGSGITVVSGSGNDSVTISSTATTTPGGSSGQVQYNDGGSSFGGISGVTSAGTNMIFGDSAIFVGQDITHDGDTDTKIIFGDDAIGLTVGGEQLVTVTEAGQDLVQIGDGGDVDFQVRTLGDDNTLFVKGDDDRVGIGVAAPSAKLHVAGDVHIEEATPTITVKRTDNSNNSALQFLGSGGNTANMVHLASSNDLVFSTHDGSSQEEILRLGSYYGSSNRQVILLSGSAMADSAMQPKESVDINFFVSGAIGSKDTSIKGTSVFSGDTVVSGVLKVGAEKFHELAGGTTGGTISGSIHHTSGGISYIAGGANVTVVSSSNGQIKISTAASATPAGTVGQLQMVDNSGNLSGSDALWWGGGPGGTSNNRGLHVSGTIHVASNGVGSGIQFDTSAGTVPSIFGTPTSLSLDGDDYTLIYSDIFTGVQTGLWVNREASEDYGDFSVETGEPSDPRRLGIALDSGKNQAVILGGTVAALPYNTGLATKMYTDYKAGNAGSAMPDDVGLFISGSILGKSRTTPQYQGWRGTTVVGGDLQLSGALYLSDLSQTVGEQTLRNFVAPSAGNLLYSKNDSAHPYDGAELFMKTGNVEVNISNQMSGSVRSETFWYPRWQLYGGDMNGDLFAPTHTTTAAGRVAQWDQDDGSQAHGTVITTQIPERCSGTSKVYFTVYFNTNLNSGGADVVLGISGRCNPQLKGLSNLKVAGIAGNWLDDTVSQTNMFTGWQPFAAVKDSNGWWSTTLQSVSSFGDYQWLSSRAYEITDLINSGDASSSYVPLNPGDVIDFAISRQPDNSSGGLQSGQMYVKWIQINWIP